MPDKVKAVSRTSDVKSMELPLSARRRLNDYSKKRTRRLSVFMAQNHAQEQYTPTLSGFCSSLTDWNVDQLRRRSETNTFKLSKEEQLDVAFQVRRQRLEQHRMKIQNDQRSSDGGGKKKPSRRQDLAIVVNLETGLPQAMPEQEKEKRKAAPKIQRRASIGGCAAMPGILASDTHPTTDFSPVPLRRNSSMTELGDKLKSLPGHSPPRTKDRRVGAGAYDNQMTHQLQMSILNADVPQEKKKRLLRRSSLGGGSMHSSSMDSSAHSTSAYGGDDGDNPYGYGEETRQVSLEIDASQALRRMRRSSIGGVVATAESEMYGYGDAAPNIRVLNPVQDAELPHSRRRVRRGSVGTAMPQTELDPHGYEDVSAPSRTKSSQHPSTSPEFEAARAMGRMRRSSIGGLLPSSSAHGVSHPNVRWLSQSLDPQPIQSAKTTMPQNNGPIDRFSPVRTNSGSLSRMLEQEKKRRKPKAGTNDDPTDSLRGLEKLALDLSGANMSPKRSPRRALKIDSDLTDGLQKRSPTKVVAAGKVALGA